jgi:putative PIN family toxin of toxin-antitoxin system
MNVVDANVLVSGLRSRNGASHLILRAMLTGDVPITASPAVILEYEAVLKRPGMLGRRAWISPEEIDQILDVICLLAVPALPSFRFRPILNDPGDDLYLECALAGGADTIITHDVGFSDPKVQALGIRALTPRSYLEQRRKGP